MSISVLKQFISAPMQANGLEDCCGRTCVARKNARNVMARWMGEAAFPTTFQLISVSASLKSANELTNGGYCYFVHPYSPWERGTNENTNGLIRQYFPKNSDFTTISQQEINFTMDRLTNWPRKRLGYLSSNKVFFKSGVAL